MNKKFFTLLMVIAFFNSFTFSLINAHQECAASLLSLIEKNDLPQVQLKLKDCATHACVEDQFKSVKELVKDKPGMLDKIEKVQYEINEKHQKDTAKVEQQSTLGWLMKCYGYVLAFAAAAGIITKMQELNEELKDIERAERLAKKRHGQ